MKLSRDFGLDVEGVSLAGVDWLARGNSEWAGAPLASLLHLPYPQQQVCLDGGKLVVTDLPHLALHLGFHIFAAQPFREIIISHRLSRRIGCWNR